MTAKLTLGEEIAFSWGYDSIDTNKANPHTINSNPAMYHLFEAGRAVRMKEKEFGTWDMNKGVWTKEAA